MCITHLEDLSATVRAAAAGDERAWGRLVMRFGAALRAVARRHRLNHADQEEVVQRTWLCLVEQIHTLRDPTAVAGWLVTTAHRECLRLHRTQAREVLEAELPVAVERSTVDDIVIAAERAAALHAAVDRLPQRHRSLLRLQLARPALDYGEIGGALGMPVGSIGPTRGRSLAHLRWDAGLLKTVA
jgi:RNA polymerase sigma factor (sigma-70 family)